MLGFFIGNSADLASCDIPVNAAKDIPVLKKSRLFIQFSFYLEVPLVEPVNQKERQYFSSVE